jgi:hypothetical protein
MFFGADDGIGVLGVLVFGVHYRCLVVVWHCISSSTGNTFQFFYE